MISETVSDFANRRESSPEPTESVTVGRSKVEAYSVANLVHNYTVRVHYYTEERDPAQEIEDDIGSLLRRGVDAKLLDSGAIEVKGRPGKEIIISYNGHVIHRARVFAGDMEFIQVSCELPDTEGDARNGKAFIESFEFLNDRRPARPPGIRRRVPGRASIGESGGSTRSRRPDSARRGAGPGTADGPGCHRGDRRGLVLRASGSIGGVAPGQLLQPRDAAL